MTTMSAVQCIFTTENVRLVDDPITFPPINPNRVILSHEDALVLMLGLDGFDMWRILVDLRSSTDLLQMSTYRQMRYSPYALENLSWVLSRFNGTTTISMGGVVLLVQANATILNVRFFVIKDFSPYNTIMGHLWLHKMKAILSTYYQISYLIEVGQVDLHGNHLVVSQCYQVAMEFECADPIEDEFESSTRKRQ